MNIKGKGQRLIPEELLKYLEAYKEAHPDPTQGGGATLDDIVDSQGNKRFIEANGVPNTTASVIIANEISFSYYKWSLSGTHLMFVIAGLVPKSKKLPGQVDLVSFELPAYVMNKIMPLNQDNYIYEKSDKLYAYSLGSANISTVLRKYDDKIVITNLVDSTNPSSSWGAYFRIQFDLLIDSE